MFISIREVAVIFLVPFVLLEIFLRFFPVLIPLPLLMNFQVDLRGNIARRIGLPTKEQVLFLERDDDSPPLQIFRPFQPISLSFNQEDRKLGAHSPVEMDENGFCKQAGSYRDHIDAIVLGDSYSWCLGVKTEELWTNQLAPTPGFSVYSLGVFGSGLFEYLQIFKKFGTSRSPRVVMMNVFGGNDLQSAINFYEYRERFRTSGKREFLARPCVILPSRLCAIYRFVKESFGKYSYTFNLVANFTRDTAVRIKETVSPPAERNFGYTVLVKGKPYAFNRSNTSDWDSADRVRSGEVSFGLFDEALADFTALSRKFDFAPVVVFSPPPYVAYEGYATFDDPAVAELAVWFDQEQRKYFKSKAKEFGYLFLDFTPALREATAESDELIYFPANLYLTRYGHRVLSRAAYGFLQGAGL